MIQKAFFLLFLVISAGAQARRIPEGDWYRSNALGALLEQILWLRRGEFEWTAQRRVREGGDTIVLYQDGKAVETRIRDLDDSGLVKKVRVVRDNATRDLYELDERGRVIREEFWAEGRRKGELLYLWNMDQLVGREYRGAAGRSEWKDEIFRTPSGRIRRIVRTVTGGTREWHAWSWGEAGLGSESGREGQETFFSAYNPGGLVRRRELGVDGDLVQVSEYFYENDILVRRVDNLVPDQLRETRRFDSDGRIILIEYRENERLTAQERRRYEGELLVQVDRVVGLTRERRTLTYDTEDKLVREVIFSNGELESVLTYQEEKLTLEELYLGGRKVVEIRWQENEKVEEVYFDLDGSARTRDPRRTP